MSTSKKLIPWVIVLVLVGVGGAGWWIAHRGVSAHRHNAKTVYYCPMHPTYTSDKPGDCPICNMKLVKREETLPAASQAKPQTAKDICYMHNCPKAHEGQPCPMLVVAKAGEKIVCPICGTHVAEASEQPGAKKILYWTDPMLPGYQSDTPGTSPMGMELVPVYEEVAGAGAAVGTPAGYAPILVTPQKQQLIGVKTSVVKRTSLTHTIRTVGTVAHDMELYQTEAEYLEAVKTVKRLPTDAATDARAQAQRLVELSRVKLKHLGLSDALIDEVGTREEPEHSLLFGGHAGGRVWIYAAIYEYELPLVHVGDTVTVELTAANAAMLTGALRAIDALIDPMTRTARIRIEVEDTGGVLKPDMYVNVVIAASLPEALVIPHSAVLDTGTQRLVFVDKGQGIFEPREVTVGATADDVVAVTAGVAEGERVVTSGNFLIDSESRLQGALEGMSSGDHQHGQ